MDGFDVIDGNTEYGFFPDFSITRQLSSAENITGNLYCNSFENQTGIVPKKQEGRTHQCSGREVMADPTASLVVFRTAVKMTLS